MNKVSRMVLMMVLAAPVFVFAFLKFFGKNKFDLPILHQSVSDWPSACPKPAIPFVLPDSVKIMLGSIHRPVLVVWGDLPDEARRRLPVEMDTSGVRLMEIRGYGWPCVFGAEKGSSAVLTDSEGRLRSIYKQLDRDETDRIIMETKILLNDY